MIDWKLLVLGSSIDAQRRIGEQIREKAALIREVMGTAEISLEGMRWRPDYEINESLFCTEVLSPLLRRMGFVSVRYLPSASNLYVFSFCSCSQLVVRLLCVPLMRSFGSTFLSYLAKIRLCRNRTKLPWRTPWNFQSRFEVILPS